MLGAIWHHSHISDACGAILVHRRHSLTGFLDESFRDRSTFLPSDLFMRSDGWSEFWLVPNHWWRHGGVFWFNDWQLSVLIYWYREIWRRPLRAVNYWGFGTSYRFVYSRDRTSEPMSHSNDYTLRKSNRRLDTQSSWLSQRNSVEVYRHFNSWYTSWLWHHLSRLFHWWRLFLISWFWSIRWLLNFWYRWN